MSDDHIDIDERQCDVCRSPILSHKFSSVCPTCHACFHWKCMDGRSEICPVCQRKLPPLNPKPQPEDDENQPPPAPEISQAGVTANTDQQPSSPPLPGSKPAPASDPPGSRWMEAQQPLSPKRQSAVSVWVACHLTLILSGVLLHLVSFAGLNCYLNYRIDQAYHDARFDPRHDFTAWRHGQKIILWQQADLRTWLQEFPSFSARYPMPAAKLLSEIMAGDRRRCAALHHLVTGQRSGWWVRKVSSRYWPAQRIVDELARLDDGQWYKLLLAGSAGEERRLLLVRAIEVLHDAVADELRRLKMINGAIQWLTLGLFWILAIHLFRRTIKLGQARQATSFGECRRPEIVELLGELHWRYPELVETLHDFFGGTVSGVALRDKIAGVEQAVEDKVYAPLQFSISTIPSLGFIGTVMGMARALLKADLLFAAHTQEQRQIAVTEITRQLGFAFDTTFIALLVGIAAGVLYVVCRRRERMWMEEIRATVERREER